MILNISKADPLQRIESPARRPIRTFPKGLAGEMAATLDPPISSSPNPAPTR